MAIKTDRIEARLSPDERALIDRAAALSGTSSSAFVVRAAVDRADEVLTSSMVTATPAEYFDRLLAALDEPDPVPGLAEAVVRARRSTRITTR
ncbi:MAG: DUF1778 domain-containing protein [Ilumatobacteraceae bacterium]